MADETATVDDDFQESKTQQRSYVEVNGPVPKGPVIDENGLAQQVSGAAPTPITSDSLIPPDSEVSPTSEDTPAAKEEAAESAEAPTSEGSPESEESPTSEESPAKAASPLRGGDSSKSVAFAPPKHPPHMCNVAKTLLTRQRQFRQGSPVPLRSPHSSARRRSAREVSHGLWIIWLGVGLSACMASLGYHWLLSQSALWICGIVWGIFNIPLSEFFRSLFFTAAAIFFKDFDVAGTHRVPPDGPVMLVCGPHANQFIDPIVVLKALNFRKDIGFLSAASTLRKKIIGNMARSMNSIPVERAQDLAKRGSGSVTLKRGQVTVYGQGTAFTKEFKPNSSLALAVPGVLDGRPEHRVVRVAEIISDTELRLTKPLLFRKSNTTDAIGSKLFADPETLSARFKVFPHVDLAHTFEAVYEHLHKHNVVGIFPEGGSHDQTKMLPLKVGCAIMALGACASCPGLPLRIIPVGINYFRGHRFRSRVFIDIGEPIFCSAKQIDDFKKGGAAKFNACNDLLRCIRVGLKTVTVESENFNDLQFIRAIRRLYTSGVKEKPGAIERFKMTKAFSSCYARDREVPAVKKLYSDILHYRHQLSTYQISDHAILEAGQTQDKTSLDFELFTETKRKLVWLLLKMIVFVCISIPGLIASLPIMVTVRLVARSKARQAKKRSTVKVAGRDVMATWKILISFIVVPLVHLLYTLGCYFLISEPAAVAWFFIMPFFALLTIQSTEHLKADFHQFKPLFNSTFCKATPSNDLIVQRVKLENHTREIVHTYEWDKDLRDSKVYRKFSESPYTWEEDEWNNLI